MTPDEIERLRELDKARTQGEWDQSVDVIHCRDYVIADCNFVEDAAYIVAACNALPRLLDELEAYRKREAVYKKIVSAAEDLLYSDRAEPLSRDERRLLEALRLLRDEPEAPSESLQGGAVSE